MLRKGAKCLLTWTLLDENIENVEQLRLDPDEQRELGCVVGEHVFLEYPWAFVPRDAVLALSRKPGSALSQFRQQIATNESSWFLIGYSSNTLSSQNFVICLTEEATLAVVARNKRITKAILERVSRKITCKNSKTWKSLSNKTEISESFVKSTRGYLEIEVSLPPERVGLYRQLSDQSPDVDGRNCAELVPREDERYTIVEKKCISRGAQTHLTPRPAEVQTYTKYTRNAWTQYGHDDTLDGKNIDNTEEESLKSKIDDTDTSKTDTNITIAKDEASKPDEEKKPDEKTPLEQFLLNCSKEMLDIVKYNTVINLHIDDIRSLGETDSKNQTTIHHSYEQLLSLVAFSAVRGKAVSSVCWCPESKEHIIISYTTSQFLRDDHPPLPEGVDKFKFASGVLIWSLSDPLRPKLELQDYRDILAVSRCPREKDVIIGGCCTGQVVIWNIRDHHGDSRSGVKNTRKPATRLGQANGVAVARPIIVSDKRHSHQLPVRKIEWMPADYRIEPTGKLTKSLDCASTQFLTASEDGSVAVWELPPLNSERNIADSCEAFRPVFKITVCLPDESRNLCLLALCLPSIEVFLERNPVEQRRAVLNPEEEDYLKSLWIGTTRGLVRCMWEGQVFDMVASGIGECKFLNHSYAHSGPVREILRSPHLRDVLLTIGGHVFAIWKDDYLDAPLFWRRSCALYTSCSWANRPGVVLLGRDDGEMEIWDLKENSNEPVGIRSVSEKAITCLLLLESPGQGQRNIGAGDAAGVFRIFQDPADHSFETVLSKLDWFEEYIWKEVRRKRVFHNWQGDYLANDPDVLAKKAQKQAEEIRQRQEEARTKLQREHEERLRREARKRELSVPKSKGVVWRSANIERMERILLRKKGLARAELEEKRTPLLEFERHRDIKLSKAQDKVALRDEHFKQAVATEFPEITNLPNQEKQVEERIDTQEDLAYFLRQYGEIRDHVREMLSEHTK